MQQPDTIAAIATAHGRGGIGIVRISGRSLAELAYPLFGKEITPRFATFCNFLDAEKNIIDSGVAIYFKSPNSYTGEDVLELQGHGGTAVLHLVLQRCLELGARLANPGEFTQRAFLNNKLDLAQSEAVADLINATSLQAAKSALRSLSGEFSSVVHDLVDKLIHLRMISESLLDFPEEDLDHSDYLQLKEHLNDLLHSLENTLRVAKQGSLLREGANVVLVGRPNVGKSSLLNCLSGDDVALVSDIPGTTRDLIRQEIQISGIPLHITDTAGLRDAQDTVERMGIARTHKAVQRADVVLMVIDAAEGLNSEESQILAALPGEIPIIRVYNKIDISSESPSVKSDPKGWTVHLSAKTGEGIDLLRSKLLDVIGWHQEAGVFMARERHILALDSALEHVRCALYKTSQQELFAEELRLAQEVLNSITGEFTSDDLLGKIFGSFCIGK